MLSRAGREAVNLMAAGLKVKMMKAGNATTNNKCSDAVAINCFIYPKLIVMLIR